MLVDDLRVVVLVHDLKAAARFYGEALDWPCVVRPSAGRDPQCTQLPTLVVRRAEGLEEGQRVGRLCGVTLRTSRAAPLQVVRERMISLGFPAPALRGTGILYVQDIVGNRIGITEEPCLPSLQPLDSVSFFVSDLGRALPFYTRLFGAPAQRGAPSMYLAGATFCVGDVTVFVAEPDNEAQAALVGRDTGLVAGYGDLDAVVREVASGGGYVTPPYVGPAGVVAVAMDPDGNRLHLEAR